MNNDLALSHLFCRHHPSDAASLLVRLPPEPVAAFLKALSPEEGMELVRHMPTAYATQLLGYLEEDHSARLLARADFTTVARLLRPLPEARRQPLMARMDAAQNAQLSRILNYAPGSVGSLVEIPVLTALGDWSVRHARQELKKIARHALAEVPVVDDEHRFLGSVTVHALVAARDNRRLDELCEGKDTALPAYATLASIIQHPTWDRNLSLPVVDRGEILLGLLHRSVLHAHVAGARQLRARDALAPLMAMAELYWAASSTAITLLGKNKPIPETSDIGAAS